MKAAAALLTTSAVLVAACGGGGSGPKPVVERYVKALGDGDAKTACAQLTKASQKAVGSAIGQGKSCEGGLGALLKAAGEKRRKELGNGKVTSVKTSGSTSTVKVKGIPTPVKLAKEGGKWKIKSAGAGG